MLLHVRMQAVLCFFLFWYLLYKSYCNNLRSSQSIELAGIAVGLFIVIYSVTRGVLLATVLITLVSIFLFRASLEFLVSIKVKLFYC